MKSKLIFLFAFISLWFVNVPIYCLGNELLYSKVAPRSVEILVEGRLEGSGFIVSKEGLVITAHHVTKKKAKSVEAFSSYIGRAPLKRIANYKGCDLALFSLPPKEDEYPSLPLANEVPAEGTKVFLFGSPIFRHHLLLTGFVASKKGTYSWYDGAFTKTFYISGIAAPGTSGGPWLNQKGEVFGIQAAGLTTNGGHQGVNKAVEVAHIKKLIELRKDISIPTLEAAVEELWGQSHSLIQKIPEGITGLLLRQVSPNGVCAKAGIKNEDIILSINGKKYQRIEPFMDYIRSKSPGKKIELMICEPNGTNQRKVFLNLAELK